MSNHKKNMSLLLILGDYECPFTKNTINRLIHHNISFIYRAKKKDETIMDMIAPVSALTTKTSMPIIIWFKKNSDHGYIVNEWTKPYDSNAIVEDIIKDKPNLRTTKKSLFSDLVVSTSNKLHAKRLFKNSHSFVFCPEKKKL